MNIAIKVVVAAAMGAALAGPAFAQQMTEEQRLTNVVQTRQAVFKLLGYNFQPLGGMLRNPDSFNAERVQVATDRMLALAPMIPELFAEDTSEFEGAETRALDGIWSSMDDFNQKAADLQAALGALKEAADSGEQAPTLAALGGVGQACGSCHDVYRAD